VLRRARSQPPRSLRGRGCRWCPAGHHQGPGRLGGSAATGVVAAASVRQFQAVGAVTVHVTSAVPVVLGSAVTPCAALPRADQHVQRGSHGGRGLTSTVSLTCGRAGGARSASARRARRRRPTAAATVTGAARRFRHRPHAGSAVRYRVRRSHSGVHGDVRRVVHASSTATSAASARRKAPAAAVATVTAASSAVAPRRFWFGLRLRLRSGRVRFWFGLRFGLGFGFGEPVAGAAATAYGHLGQQHTAGGCVEQALLSGVCLEWVSVIRTVIAERIALIRAGSWRVSHRRRHRGVANSTAANPCATVSSLRPDVAVIDDDIAVRTDSPSSRHCARSPPYSHP